MSIRDKSIILPTAAVLALGAGLGYAQTEDQTRNETQNQEQTRSQQQSSDTASQGSQNQSSQNQGSQSQGARSDGQGTSGQTSGANQRSGQADSDRMAQAATPAIVTMLVLPMTPVGGVAPSGEQTGQSDQNSTASTTQAATKNGCWARLYEDNNYEGDSFTLVGPIDMSNMEGPFGVDWSDISSIQAGPKATITIYDNINFRDKAAQIKANQNVPELSERLGFFEEVKSIRINCPASRTG